MGGRSSTKIRNATRPKRAALTLKQERFISEFLKDLCAAKAARRAGYSEKTAGAIGAENLTKPVIWAAIQEQHQQAITDAVMSAQETLERMTVIGRTDITTFHDDQGKILPMSEWTPEMGQQVSKIESVVKNVAAGDGHVDQVLKVSIWNKIQALEGMAKYHGLATTRVDVNMTVDNSLIQAGRDRVAAAAGLRRLSEAKLVKKEREKGLDLHAADQSVLDGELIKAGT